MKSHNLDEDDVRIRPGKSKSRPRTKDRPSFTNMFYGSVSTVDRGRFTVNPEGETEILYAVKARELGRKGLVVGDRVAMVGDPTGGIDHQVRIVRREPRATELRRTADDNDPQERVIVANADRLGVVVAAANPQPRVGFIDRAIVAAMDAGVTPFLVITKADVKDPQELVAVYAELGIPIFVVHDGVAPASIKEFVQGHITVLLGHSGVGKSTLINELAPEAKRITGSVNDLTGKGKHTSTSVIAFPLSGAGGIVIDTPGIRSFGLAHVSRETIIKAYPDLVSYTVNCPRACSHDEPDCGLVEISDPIILERVASMQNLLAGNFTIGVQ
ncbi:MAG: ribosome small subunit-dependent GTPase A [Actinomycetia bacterium]|nr:ribosome small subunit-dependent GTPase A [Actinomycetes bacterium]